MIKNRIKVILAEKGIRQNDLAEGIGMNRSTLSSMMNGHQNCTLETAFDIARFLNVRIEDIFYKVDDITADDIEAMDFEDMIEKMKKIYPLYQSNTITSGQLNELYQNIYDDFMKKHPSADIDVLSQGIEDYLRLPPPIMELLLGI